MRLIVRRERSWNVHTHSSFSAKDALPKVKDMVATVASMGQKALGLTDHGNVAGSVQLYQECMKAGIKPFPGTELYVVHSRDDKKAKRHHLGVVAFTTEGYHNLVKLSTLSYKNFHNKPLVDHRDLAELADAGLLRGLAGLSGCVSGFVNESLLCDDVNAAEAYARGYSTWFDRFYIELQNHNNTWTAAEIPGMTEEHTDDWLADQGMALADRLGLPMVLSNDSHYCEHHHQNDHNALKRLVSFGPDRDDGVFQGDGFQLGDDAWFASHHHMLRNEAGLAGLQDLLECHDLAIPQLDKYAYNIPFTVENPDAALRARTTKFIEIQGLGKEHRARLEEELSIIEATGMAGYLILVAEVCDWLTEQKIFYQARGSGAGSLCCWALGITPVDPLKWSLSFERFISRDRTKPPDIDLDVEHARRGELIDYLRTRFSVSQIGTWSKNSLSGDVDPDTGEETGKGKLRVQYFARKKQLGEPMVDWRDVPEEDRDMLHRLNDWETYANYGKHAAGVILTTTQSELDQLVPQMWIASSSAWVSQFAMDDIEALGLVKLDVLGLKTLTVLHKCMDNLGREVDLDWIPMRDEKTFRGIAKGDTDGVFQLEGYAAKRGCQSLKPSRVQDVIAAMALFRPATMDSGATADYIAHKHKERVAPTRHQILDSIVRETYGIFLFQEQVISFLRALGMEPEALTKFLKAVKASNSNIGEAGKVIAGYEEMITSMAKDKGISDEDFKWAWSAVTGFAAYGFNRAHSTVYGITAYRSAYLLMHEPVAYIAALLAVAASTDKEPKYISTARGRKISLLMANVEDSDSTYSVTDKGNAIRKGLMSIKGVGKEVADAIVSARPPDGFKTLETFGLLVNHRKVTGILKVRENGNLSVGTVNKLNEAGALGKIL